MSVIGRLDRQVEDVLISPASKRRDERDTPRREPAPAATLPPESERRPEPAEESAPRAREDLPVWLL